MEKEKMVPIRVASHHSQLSVSAIRAWEQRYQAIKPQRDESNRRMYKRQDLERLNQLRIATHFGHRISGIAGLSLRQLRRLNEEDERSILRSAPERRMRPSTGAVMHYFDNCIDALRKMDAYTLLKEIENSIKEIGMLLSLEELLLPLIDHVNEECRFGELSGGHRQFLDQLIHAFLLLESMKVGGQNHATLVCQLREDPELHALRALSLINHYGWRATYLRAENPQVIIDAVWAKNARVILIVFGSHNEDPDMPNQLRHLASDKLVRKGKLILLMPERFAYADVADEVGAKLIREANQAHPLLKEMEEMN